MHSHELLDKSMYLHVVMKRIKQKSIFRIMYIFEPEKIDFNDDNIYKIDL